MGDRKSTHAPKTIARGGLRQRGEVSDRPARGRSALRFPAPSAAAGPLLLRRRGRREAGPGRWNRGRRAVRCRRLVPHRCLLGHRRLVPHRCLVGHRRLVRCRCALARRRLRWRRGPVRHVRHLRRPAADRRRYGDALRPWSPKISADVLRRTRLWCGMVGSGGRSSGGSRSFTISTSWWLKCCRPCTVPSRACGCRAETPAAACPS